MPLDADQPVSDTTGPSAFVVGTGRSGTHFLTHCLISHPDVSDLMDGKENPEVFDRVTRIAARGPLDELDELDELIEQFRSLRARCPQRVFVDQSHPNLWLVETLSEQLPDALFLAVVRDPRAVVASMLNHPGVRKRTENWTDYGIPNRFIGVDDTNVAAYEAATLPGKCAYRWLSHVRRIHEIRHRDDAMIIRYEHLVQAPEQALDESLRRLGVTTRPDQAYAPDARSLEKWRDVLSIAEQREVLAIADSQPAYRELVEELGHRVDW